MWTLITNQCAMDTMACLEHHKCRWLLSEQPGGTDLVSTQIQHSETLAQSQHLAQGFSPGDLDTRVEQIQLCQAPVSFERLAQSSGAGAFYNYPWLVYCKCSNKLGT